MEKLVNWMDDENEAAPVSKELQKRKKKKEKRKDKKKSNSVY